MTRLALRGLAARPLRTALTTLAIVLGVALVCGSLVLTDTQRRAAQALSAAAYDGTDAVVTARTAFRLNAGDWAAERPGVSPAVLDRVRRVPGVAVAVGDVTDENARLIGTDGRPLGQGPYFGIGFDAFTAGAERLTPFRLQGGRWARGDGEVVVDQRTAEEDGLRIGSRVRVAGEGPARAFTVVGIARFGDVRSLGTATAAVFDLDTARAVLGRGDALDAVLVGARAGVPGADLRARLARALGDDAAVTTAAADDRFTFGSLEQFIAIIRTALLAFGGVAILVGALTIVNSLSITLAQRTRELALMRLVGASRRQLVATVTGEAAVMGVLGSLAGVGLGVLLAEGLDTAFASLGLDLPEAGTVVAAHTVGLSLLVGTVVTTLAGLVPAIRATRAAPVTALRDAAEGSRRTGIAGGLVRPAVSLLSRPAERLGGIAGSLARRNALRDPGRTAATAGALAVGVTLVTLVAVVAAGLKDTTRGSIERRLDATHVVTGKDGWSPTGPQVAAALRAASGVDGVTTIRQDIGRAFGDNERVNALSGGHVGFDVSSGDARADRLGRDGAIVDEGWAKEHGLGAGDSFALQSPSGERMRLTVRAIEASPVIDGLDLGPITIGAERYDDAFGNHRSVLTVVDAPGVATADLRRTLAPFPGTDVRDRDAFVEMRTQEVDVLMAIFVVLLVLTVLVGLSGIVNALVLATFERRRELGMLQAVGMSRRQVRRMIRHESVVTSLLGTAAGIALGLALAAAVAAALADAGLAFAVPVATLAVLAAVAVVAGVLAAVLPARRAARIDPLTALAYE